MSICSTVLNEELSMDTHKYPEERENLRSIFESVFPNLGEDYEVLETSNPRYNCIAHLVGNHEEWIQPEIGPLAAPLALMDSVYEEIGYQRIETLDFAFDLDRQKVVLYGQAAGDGTILNLTHAAVQDAAGNWESKLGQGPLIRHRTPEALSGPSYGNPVAVYTKKR